MQGGVTAWPGPGVKSNAGDDTGSVPDGATGSVVTRACGPGVGDGQRRSGEGGEAEGQGGDGGKVAEAGVATKANGDRGDWGGCGGGFGVMVRVREVGRGGESMCAAGGPQVGDGRRRGGRGEAAIDVKWRWVGRARKEGGAGCAAVHDVAEAQHGIDLETPKAIHAEIENYDHVAHARRVPLDC